jgi:hypothetical protein
MAVEQSPDQDVRSGQLKKVSHAGRECAHRREMSARFRQPWRGRAFCLIETSFKKEFSMHKIIATSKSLPQFVKTTLVTGFLLAKKAASGFAEEAVKIFVVAAIVGVMVWVGTIVDGMLRNSGSML